MSTVVPDKSNPDSKKVQVESMFDSIAPKYDLLNHTLSLNIDKIWRRRLRNFYAVEQFRDNFVC